MFSTERTSGLRFRIVDALLFFVGWIIFVFSGTWFLIGHAPVSFANAPFHSEPIGWVVRLVLR